MAELNPYKVSVTAAEADAALSAGLLVSKTTGLLLGDGQGNVKTAVAGDDYGLPMLKGNGPPKPSAAATLGQHYFDMQATQPPYEYVCTGYLSTGYVWRTYGDTGTNFAPKGLFLTLDALREGVANGLVPEPTDGTAYYVGSEAPYAVYVFDGITKDWIYIGSLTSSTLSSVTGVPPHGSTGEVLAKLSAIDFDVGWVDLAASAIAALTGSPLPVVAGGTGASEALAARKNLDVDRKRLVFSNIVVQPSIFAEDSTSEDYPYRAAISLSGVTSTMSPDICFGFPESANGMFAPTAISFDGGVYIYSNDLPESSITIPKMFFYREE